MHELWSINMLRIIKQSGAVNDTNCYTVKTFSNLAYLLESFQQLITISLETMKIVRNLSELEIKES